MKNMMKLKKLKFVVFFKKDFTADIYYGSNEQDAKQNKQTVKLNSKTQLTSDINMQLVKKEFMKNKIIMTDSILKREGNIFMLTGQAFTTVKDKRVNEFGFSLVELAVSCAIIAVLTTLAMPHYFAFQEQYKEQQEQLQSQQQETQYTLNSISQAMGN